MKRLISFTLLLVMMFNAFDLPASGQVISTLAAKEDSIEKKYGVAISTDKVIMDNQIVYNHVLSTIENVYERFPAGLIKETTDYFKSKKITTQVRIRYYNDKDSSQNYDDGIFEYNTKTATLTYRVSPDFIEVLDEWVVAHDMGHLIHKFIDSKYGANNFKKKWTPLNGSFSYKGNNWYKASGFELIFAKKMGTSSYENDVATTIEMLVADPHDVRIRLLNNPNSALAKKVTFLNDVLDQCSNSIVKGQTIWSRGMPQAPSEKTKSQVAEAFDRLYIPKGPLIDSEYEMNFSALYNGKITRQDFCHLINRFIKTSTQMKLEDYLKSKGKNYNWYYRASLSSLGELASVETNHPFMDIDDNAIFNLYSLGVFEGLNIQDYFNPGLQITREEAALLIYNASKAISSDIKKSASASADSNLISTWARDGVDFVISNNIMGLAGNQKFAPKDNLTYEEAYVAILNLCKLDLLKTQLFGSEPNFVIQPKYDSANSFSEGLALVTQGANHLYIDKTGKEVIKLPYTGDTCNPKSFKGGYAVIVLSNPKNMGKTIIAIDKTGKEVLRINNAIYEPSQGFDKKFIDIITFKGGDTSVVDERFYADIKGNKYFYDSMVLSGDDSVIVESKLKYGLLDKDFKVILKPEYNSVEYLGEGLYSFNKVINYQDHFGVISSSGKVIAEPDFNEVIYLGEGLVYVNKDDKWGVFDKDGNEKIKMGQYSYATPSGDFFIFGDGRNCHMIHKSGTVLFENCKSIEGFNEGYAIIQKNGGSIIIDSKGQEVYRCQGDLWSFVYSEGLGVIRQGSSWAIIDKTFKEIARVNMSNAIINEFSDGMATFLTYSNKWGCIDKTGKIIVTPQYNYIEDFKYGYAVFKNESELYGCIDKTGRVILEPIYDEIEIGDGIIIVKKGDLYGAFNQNGKAILDIKYEGIGFPYDEQYNCYYIATGIDPATGEVFYIDKSGRMYSKFWTGGQGYAVVGNSHLVTVSDSHTGQEYTRTDYTYGYYNPQGEQVTPLKYNYTREFDDDIAGAAWVETDYKSGYIDKTGKEVIPAEYVNIGEFVNGLAPASKGFGYGYIDTTGKHVIPFIYESAMEFCDGLALVNKNGKYGYIAMPSR